MITRMTTHMTISTPPEVITLAAGDVESHVPALGALLHACVLGGASVGFVLPFTTREAEAFWSGKVLPAARAGGLSVLVAREAGMVMGTVQLDHAMPPNQPHRAEVRKLLVHPDYRRRGVARALMSAVEDLARGMRRSLLTLDTRTGDAAEPLYGSLGYASAGVIPDFCRDTIEDRLDSTTIMYKRLG